MDASLSAGDSITFAKVAPIHAVLASHRSSADFAKALHTLATDGSVSNRVIAVMTLANFANRDSAWWALMDAQRDPAGVVEGTASQVLRSMTKRAPRTVDWQPVADRVRYLLDGTNLFAFDNTFLVLSATDIGPSMTRALIGGGGEILRDKLHSPTFAGRDASTEFVSRLSGLPATTEVVELERWVRNAAIRD